MLKKSYAHKLKYSIVANNISESTRYKDYTKIQVKSTLTIKKKIVVMKHFV